MFFTILFLRCLACWWVSVLHFCACFLAYFFAFLLLCVHLRACRICCSDFVNYLACFEGQLSSFAVCVRAGCCRCYFLDLNNYLLPYSPFFFYVHTAFYHPSMLPVVFFPCCSFYWCFLSAVQPCMFLLHQTIVCTDLYLLVWLFFCYCLQIFGFNFCNTYITSLCAPKLHTIPPLCPLWPLGHPLQRTAVFFPWPHHKIPPACPFRPLCDLFFRPPSWPYVLSQRCLCINTDLHPFLTI